MQIIFCIHLAFLATIQSSFDVPLLKDFFILLTIISLNELKIRDINKDKVVMEPHNNIAFNIFYLFSSCFQSSVSTSLGFLSAKVYVSFLCDVFIPVTSFSRRIFIVTKMKRRKIVKWHTGHYSQISLKSLGHVLISYIFINEFLPWISKKSWQSSLEIQNFHNNFWQGAT